VYIPSELKDKIIEGDDEILHTDWTTLKSSLKSFADKYIPDNLENKNSPDKTGGE
jgi:hypothetical protein